MRPTHRIRPTILLLALTLAAPFPTTADDDDFVGAVGAFFGAAPDRVAYASDHFDRFEVPVVLWLSSRTDARPEDLLRRRRAGEAWFEIGLSYGLGPEVYYVPIERDPGPPYGKAWGYYRNHPREQWSRIRLDDGDVINLVNLRFLSEHHRLDPWEIAHRRAAGRDFADIHDELAHGRGRGRGRGRGHDKDKDHGPG
jgi:hypothetical protein